ncbi:MAG: oligosaccharide flippase family protein [Flavobacteriales bacterium]|jgi:O-antigen/teichoic acid export membrane protein|nr:oligosaccharide flippase family protein [Flavobacteriales bacterium]MBK7942972.1 oligosaccharide flippase family protein [Flavobacteriales bacterium]
MSVLRKLAGQTAIYGLSSIVARFLNFLLTPLYTSKGVFAPEEFGIITSLYAWAAFVNVVLTFGMETTFFRFAHRKELDPKRAYATAFFSVAGLALFFTLVCALFPDAIASGIRYPEQGQLVLMLALALGLDAMTALPMARLRNEGRPWRFVSVNLLNVVVTIALSLYFFAYAKPHDPSIGVGHVFLINLIASAVKFLVLVPQWPRLGAFDKTLLRPMLVFAAPLAIAGLAGMVNETADRAVLKYLLPADIADEQIGIYGACYKLAVLITLFIQAFRMGAEPFFFSHAKEKNSAATFARIMNVFVAVCMSAFLLVMLFLDLFKWFIPNEAYHAGLRVVPILMLANVFLGIYYNQSVWYKLTDRTRAGSTISIVGAAITLVCLFALIPSMGYMGAAWATLICYASMAAISYAWGQKHYPVPYNVTRVLGYMAGAAVLWYISLLMSIHRGDIILVRVLFLTGFLALVWRLERTSIQS